MVGMDADRRDLGVLAGLHALARHRDQLPLIRMPRNVPSSWVRARTGRDWSVLSTPSSPARRQRRARRSRRRRMRLRRRADHLFAGLGEQDLELGGRRHGSGVKSTTNSDGDISAPSAAKPSGDMSAMSANGAMSRRIAPRQRAALRQGLLPGRQRTPDRMIKRMDRRVRWSAKVPRSAARAVVEADDHGGVGDDDGVAALLAGISSPPFTAVTVTVP